MFWTKHWIETIKECIESLRDWVEALHNKQNEQQKQIDLILKELGKEYVPEKDTKEPAKLVDRKHTENVGIFADYLDVMKAKLENEPMPKSKSVLDIFESWVLPEFECQLKNRPKKKRKYVKSGKYAKKKK